jgi:hypothetical protein
MRVCGSASGVVWADRGRRSVGFVQVVDILVLLVDNVLFAGTVQLAQLDRVDLLLDQLVQSPELVELLSVKGVDLCALAVEGGAELLWRGPLCRLCTVDR